MNLVLFDDALDHLTRVHRVLRMPQGHALLVGVGGSGKQSICRLAAFAAECEVFEIMLSRGYNENSFREDLKVLYSKLGMENKKVVFLFTDQHVVEEGTVIQYGLYTWHTHFISIYSWHLEQVSLYATLVQQNLSSQKTVRPLYHAIHHLKLVSNHISLPLSSSPVA